MISNGATRFYSRFSTGYPKATLTSPAFVGLLNRKRLNLAPHGWSSARERWLYMFWKIMQAKKWGSISFFEKNKFHSRGSAGNAYSKGVCGIARQYRKAWRCALERICADILCLPIESMIAMFVEKDRSWRKTKKYSLILWWRKKVRAPHVSHCALRQRWP